MESGDTQGIKIKRQRPYIFLNCLAKFLIFRAKCFFAKKSSFWIFSPGWSRRHLWDNDGRRDEGDEGEDELQLQDPGDLSRGFDEAAICVLTIRRRSQEGSQNHHAIFLWSCLVTLTLCRWVSLIDNTRIYVLTLLSDITPDSPQLHSVNFHWFKADVCNLYCRMASYK